jgi:anti-sigma factor RsiW
MAKRWISASLDGELDESKEQALKVHLASCLRCRAFATRLSTLEESLDSVSAADLRWGFADRVMARIVEAQPTKKSAGSLVPLWVRWLRPAPIGVGAAAFCAGAALVILANGQSEANVWQRGDVVAALADNYLGIETQPMLEEELVNLLPESKD